MASEKKKRDLEELKQKQKDKFHEVLAAKRAKLEWKSLQETLLKTMTDRLRRWRYKGTWDARRELYELLTAASASLKAQYFRSTDGLEPEAGAEMASKKAIAKMGKSATPQ